MADTLDDFERTTFTAEGKTRTIYRTGSGPAVIVISEMPGITPQVAEFGRTVAGAGFTAVHAPPVRRRRADGHTPATPSGRSPKACISKEFTVLALGRTSPIISWLRALARDEHQRCGGPGVGAVGMCFTGGFALGMMVDDVVVAPVLSQPSLPFPLTRAKTRGPRAVRRRPGAGQGAGRGRHLRARAPLHRRQDRAPPSASTVSASCSATRFVGVELDSSPGNPHGHKKMAHSVLTEDLDDRPGTPTRAALDQVLAFFTERLAG